MAKKKAPAKKKAASKPAASEVVEVDDSGAIATVVQKGKSKDLAAEAQDLLNAAQVTMLAGGIPPRLLSETAFNDINEKLAGIRG